MLHETELSLMKLSHAFHTHLIVTHCSKIFILSSYLNDMFFSSIQTIGCFNIPDLFWLSPAAFLRNVRWCIADAFTDVLLTCCHEVMMRGVHAPTHLGFPASETTTWWRAWPSQQIWKVAGTVTPLENNWKHVSIHFSRNMSGMLQHPTIIVWVEEKSLYNNQKLFDLHALMMWQWYCKVSAICKWSWRTARSIWT